MNCSIRTYLAATALALGLLPFSAQADSISPNPYSATLAVGESVTITKTVTVSDEASTSKVDVFFLADETGSMYGEIAAVASSASSILSSVSGAGDIAFGVGGYRDVGDAWVYRQLTDLTTDTTVANSAIGNWVAGGGGDIPEANLYALQSVAEGTSWRTGSERILVWFGDAPGHDPSLGGVTEVTATAALVGAGIQVEAVDVGSMDSAGQATRIADATGGTLHSGISSSTISDTILAAIETAISEYSEVSLDISEVPAGVDVSVVPGAYSGSWNRSEPQTFDFEVTFTGLTEGTYDFDIYGTVDGGRVATERDHIVVGAGGPPMDVPEPTALMLMGLGLAGLGAVRSRKQRH